MSNLAVPAMSDLSSPGVKTIAVTPNDGTDLEFVVKSLWINTDGVVNGIAYQDEEPRAYTVMAGTPLPIAFRRILATGTTATFVAVIK